MALKRIIILPKFLCFCDELWMYALEDKEDVKCKYAIGVFHGCLLLDGCHSSDTAANLPTTEHWSLCQGVVKSPTTLWGLPLASRRMMHCMWALCTDNLQHPWSRALAGVQVS